MPAPQVVGRVESRRHDVSGGILSGIKRFAVRFQGTGSGRPELARAPVDWTDAEFMVELWAGVRVVLRVAEGPNTHSIQSVVMIVRDLLIVGAGPAGLAAAIAAARRQIDYQV